MTAPVKSTAGTVPVATRRGSAVERLVERIQGMIADKSLAFGDSLPTERELGLMFQSSRNTVREALQHLRAYGIIDIRPKAGAVLANRQSQALSQLMTMHHRISPASFREVQGFRKIIESGAGEQVLMTVTEAQLQHLEDTNRRILASTDVAASALNDFAFHDELVGLTGNSVLQESFRYHRQAILDIMALGKENKPINEATYHAHREIIDALKARDRIAYAYLVNRHLDYGMRFVEAGDAVKGDDNA